MFNFRKFLILLILSHFKTIIPIKIGITSIPKCGTFLLVNCIELLKKEKGTNVDGTHLRKLENITKNNFFYCHLAHSNEYEAKLKKENFKIFFIYRDPRDQIVSHAYWIKKLYVGYKNQNIDHIITMLIKCINLLYPPYLKWLKSEIVCPIRFENLIGDNGGGKKELQEMEIEKIAKLLNVNFNDAKNECAKKLFGSGPTYREGKIGSWKNHFSNEQKKLFKKIAGNLLIELGYEKDFNW